MNWNFQTLKEKGLQLLNLGLFHIVCSNVINKIITFVSNVIIIRILTKDEYGIYGYSSNIQNFFLLLNGLGLLVGMLQFCSEKADENLKSYYYSYAAKIGCLFDIGLAILMFLFSVLFPFQIEGAATIFRMLAFIPLLVYMKEYICIYFRSRRENKKFSLSMNINSAALLLFSALGAKLGGLVGYVVGIYAAHIITIFLTGWLAGSELVCALKVKLRGMRSGSPLLRYSSFCCVTNTASQTLYLMDTFLVGTMIAQAAVVANYKVASALPFQFYFIPQSIVAFVQPYFAYHLNDWDWIRKRSFQFIGANALVNMVVGIGLLIVSKPFINIVYGASYMDCLPLFRVLTVSYILGSCIRTPAGNILGSLRKIKFNFIVALVSGLINIFLDIYLIGKWGSMGAAVATLVVTSLSGIVTSAYLIYLILINTAKRKTD